MENRAEHVFKAFKFEQGNEKKYAKLIDKFDDHFCTEEEYYS